jgi:Mor family transcriptional regulator
MSLITITDVISAGLQGFSGMPPAAADELARAICCSAAKQGHAGTEYYLHIHGLPRSQIGPAIRREFNGRNIKDLCRKYGVHRTTVYRAVRRGG